ncbi:3-hydroxyisobutyrate dehydrogenase [Geodia barretti]|uniref:3-hydroxyisobutyrate dehydrogenase n=1 Tax=Geodia barretti TaxID=519541 RepID=A0AA35TVT2_GEOBA|nr:3-hydroxyisobutyrate dehydrogenase [Geodia barretti]
MAMNVVNAGHRTKVHDVRPEAATDLLEAGAVWAETPADAARGSDVVMGSLPGPLEVEAVVNGDQGVLDGAAEGSVYIDLATNSPSTVPRVRTDAADLGMLTVMVGGDPDTLERVRPVLNAIADPSRIFYCGPVGSGAICKLCNNLVSHTTFSVLAEALTIGLKAGVPLETLSAVMAAGLGIQPQDRPVRVGFSIGTSIRPVSRS